jgi:hypothetical protein
MPVAVLAAARSFLASRDRVESPSLRYGVLLLLLAIAATGVAVWQTAARFLHFAMHGS